MKPLPIGIQTFSKIIEGNYIYIDKTKYIYNLIKNSTGVYFLSRPRRFGKSLLVSTLEEIFSGNKELFKGLWLETANYNWTKHPVIKMDWSLQKSRTTEELIEFIHFSLDEIASKYNISLPSIEYYNRFRSLILQLKKQEKVVILIDEYDKPIIDHLDNPKVAMEMREVLKGFYTVLKGNDAHIRFLFLTGVSKFSKAGIFSNLNHLNDLTVDQRASCLLGITEAELLDNFSEYMEEFSQSVNKSKEILLDKIRFWYNGYKFTPTGTSVYNPFSTLLLFDKHDFMPHWFETGTPTFLVELIKNTRFEIEQIPAQVQLNLFSTYEIEYLEIMPLLFQTGYLTIKEYNEELRLYTLDYPNFEVKEGFTTHLLRGFTKKTLSDSILYKMIDALRAKDFETYFEAIQGIFANIEYDLHISYERYYQTVFYLIFTMMGLKVKTEVKTNLGRIDLVIEDDSVYVFEFKLVSEEDAKKKRVRKDKYAREALNQIKIKKYYERFLNSNKKIYLFGAEFKNRNVGKWIVEEM